FTLWVPCTLPHTAEDSLPLLPPQPPAVAPPHRSRTPLRPLGYPQSVAPSRPAPSLTPPPGSVPPPPLLDSQPAPARPAANGTGAAVPGAHRLLVLESAPGGLLTLLAYSAASDLADVSGPVEVQTVTAPEEAVDLLRAEPRLASLPVLAHTRDNPAGAQARLAQYRLAEQQLGGPGAATRPLELLLSLDDLRGRIALYLSAGPIAAVGALSSATGPHPVTHPAPPPGRHEALAGQKVLVIDDDVRNVYAVASSLEQYGVTVLRASDGREGIATLTAQPDVGLILMDVMMPEMDGYVTMAAIRRMPEFAALPIIAVTARAMPGDREKSLDAGASDYVTKPVDTEELLSRMERWLTGQA